MQGEADDVIDRSESRGSLSVPMTATGRGRVWNARCGNHLGQRPGVIASKGRTYGSKRSDPIICSNLLQAGAVYVPSRKGDVDYHITQAA